MRYGLSLVTFHNKTVGFVLTVRQSPINWPLSVGYILAVGTCFSSSCCCGVVNVVERSK